jgi:hypothetical protein
METQGYYKVENIRFKPDGHEVDLNLNRHYTVTIWSLHPTTPQQRFPHGRCIALFSSYKKAEEFIRTNSDWIEEFTYNFVCLEPVEVDQPYNNHDETQYWFYFKEFAETRSVNNPRFGTYEAIEVPKEFENFNLVSGIG